jgi:hypothetical protein
MASLLLTLGCSAWDVCSEHRPDSARLSCRLLPLSALLPLLLLLLAAVSASANDEPRLGGPSLSPPAPHFLLPHVDNTLYVADDPARLPPAPGSTVLVLGSGGLVGRAVVKVRMRSCKNAHGCRAMLGCGMLMRADLAAIGCVSLLCSCDSG